MPLLINSCPLSNSTLMTISQYFASTVEILVWGVFVSDRTLTTINKVSDQSKKKTENNRNFRFVNIEYVPVE